MKFDRILLVLVLIFLYNCSKPKTKIKTVNGIKIFRNFSHSLNKKTLTIKINKIFSLDLSGDISMKRPPQIVSTKSHFYIQDRNNIKIYDKKGSLSKIFSSVGSGPGEFSGYAGLYILNDTLYQEDLLQRKRNIFNLNGDFILANKIDYPLVNLTCFNNLIVGTHLQYKPLNNSKFEANIERVISNSGMKIIKKENIVKKIITPGYDLSSSDLIEKRATIGKKLFIGNINDKKYQIDVYNANLDKIEIIQKSYTNKEMSKSDKNKFKISTKKYYKAIHGMWGDKYGRLWVMVKNDLNKSNNISFDIFKNGYFLNTIKLELKEIETETNNIIFFQGEYLIIYDIQKSMFNFYDYR